MLLDYGADPDAELKTPIIQRLHELTDDVLGKGATPFMRVAKSADLAIMHLLLDYGANPALEQASHTTALMIAAGLGWRDGYPIKPPFAAIRNRGNESDAIVSHQTVPVARGRHQRGQRRRQHRASRGRGGERLGRGHSVPRPFGRPAGREEQARADAV
jgi:hypothetical protein